MPVTRRARRHPAAAAADRDLTVTSDDAISADEHSADDWHTLDDAAPGALIAFFKNRFQRTDNPLYVWLAILVTPQTVPVPEWVRVYLRHGASAMNQLRNHPPKNPASAVYQALGFFRRGRSPFHLAKDDERALLIAFDIWVRQGRGEKYESAVHEVAEDYGVSVRTAARAWGSHRHRLPEVIKQRDLDRLIDQRKKR